MVVAISDASYLPPLFTTTESDYPKKNSSDSLEKVILKTLKIGNPTENFELHSLDCVAIDVARDINNGSRYHRRSD